MNEPSGAGTAPQQKQARMLPNKEMIDFLMRRKFRVWPLSVLLKSGGGTSPELQASMKSELQRLVQLTYTTLCAEYAAAVAAQVNEANEAARAQEAARPFNAAATEADFDYWAKADYWSVDESVALLLGKNPAVANWKTVQPYRQVSEGAKKFEQLRNLAMRAEAMHRGQYAQYPSEVIAWAESVAHEVPAGLRTALAEHEARKQRRTQVASAPTPEQQPTPSPRDFKPWETIKAPESHVAGIYFYQQAAREIADELNSSDEQLRALIDRMAVAIISGDLPNRDRWTGVKLPQRNTQAWGLVSVADVNEWLGREGVNYRWNRPFEPLTHQVESILHLPLSDILPHVAERISKAFFPMTWDGLSPAQRRSIAQQHDAQHDPANAEENERAFAAACELARLKAEKEQIAGLRVLTPESLQLQRNQMSDVEAKIASLNAYFKGEVPESTTTTPAIEPDLAKGSVATNQQAPANLPPGVSTTDVACAFAGLYWPGQKWTKNLNDQPDWLKSTGAKLTEGVRGNKPVQATWDPVKIASALARACTRWKTPPLFEDKIVLITEKFRHRDELAAWRQLWKAERSKLLGED